MKLKSGIYKITCTATSKFYIGSAVNLMQRKGTHFYYLRQGKHPNIHLQNSYNKYGEKYFVFEVIERCELGQLIQQEQHYIDSLKPKFNIRKKAENNFGIKNPKAASFNKVFKKGNTHRRKAVYQIDTNTLQIVNLFTNSLEADEFIGLRKGNVSRSIVKKQLAGNYLWIYVKDYSPEVVQSILQERKRRSLLDVKSIVRCDNLNNPIEEFVSISEAAKKYNLSVPNIVKVCKGQMKTTGKMYFKYQTI